MLPEPAERQAGTGRLAGFVTAPGWDPFEDRIGPMYWAPRERRDSPAMRCAMAIEAHHCNKSAMAHGGLLLAFADFSLFVLGCEHLASRAVPTIALNSDFCAVVRAGDLLEAEAEILRETGSLLFARGRLCVGETTVLGYSGILRKPRPAR